MSDMPTLISLIDRLRERADRPALTTMREKQSASWSGAELVHQADRLAVGLMREEVGAGDRVALLSEARPEWVIACLAILRAGATVVPLDVQLEDEILVHVLGDCEPRLLFCSSRVDTRLRELEVADSTSIVSFDDEFDEHGWQSWLGDGQNGSVEFPPPDPANEAFLFYTSGTTGLPKGVPLTHANITSQIRYLGQTGMIQEGDRVLLPLPLHHVYPLVIGLLTPMALGLPVILPRALTGPELIRAIRQGEASMIAGIPRLYRSLYEGIADLPGQGKVTTGVFHAAHTLSVYLLRFGLRAGRFLLYPFHQRFGPRLRLLASGGSALDPELCRQLEGFGWEVAIGYGLTETSPLLTVKLPGEGEPGSVGTPLPGVQIRIASTANGAEAPETGEIQVRGPNVFSGYHNLPEKTDEVFTEDGWLRTGDLGYLDGAGHLHITGRASTLIVTESGENIQPDHIEEAYAVDPLIREVGLFQKENQLVAVIVPETKALPPKSNPEEAVGKAVRERSQQLPSYQRITDFALTREALARTRLGKLRRHLLLEQYDRAKEGSEDVEEGASALPLDRMSDQDQALLEQPAPARVWEFLAERYPDQRLTPDTHFQVDLGVDSLEWLNLSVALGRHTGVNLSEQAISRIETVRDLLREASEPSPSEGGIPLAQALEAPEDILTAEQKQWLLPPGRLRSGMRSALHTVCTLLMRSVFHLRVRGREHIPKQGPYILTPNHSSSLDPFALVAALDRDRLRNTYWAAYTGAVFQDPIRRNVSWAFQAVPIDREQGIASSLAFGAAILQRGHNLVWFPEGSRSPDGKLRPFKLGIGLLLERFSIPVIPVYLHGCHKALPPSRWIPCSYPLTVVFGPPTNGETLTSEGEGEDAAARIAGALHHRVARLREQVEEEPPRPWPGRTPSERKEAQLT